MALRAQIDTFLRFEHLARSRAWPSPPYPREPHARGTAPGEHRSPPDESLPEEVETAIEQADEEGGISDWLRQQSPQDRQRLVLAAATCMFLLTVWGTATAYPECGTACCSHTDLLGWLIAFITFYTGGGSGN